MHWPGCANGARVMDDITFNDAAFDAQRYEWQAKAVLEAAAIGAQIARDLAPVMRTHPPYGPKSAYFGIGPGELAAAQESSAQALESTAGPVADFGTLRRYFRPLARWRGAKDIETTAYYHEGRPRGATLFLIKALEELRGALAGRWT